MVGRPGVAGFLPVKGSTDSAAFNLKAVPVAVTYLPLQGGKEPGQSELAFSVSRLLPVIPSCFFSPALPAPCSCLLSRSGLSLVAVGCSEQVTNVAEAHLPWPAGSYGQAAAGKAEAEQFLHWRWGDAPVNAYIETFLNNFFHHRFKGQKLCSGCLMRQLR